MKPKLFLLPLVLITLVFFSGCSSHRKAGKDFSQPVVSFNPENYLSKNPCKLDKEQKKLIEESLTWLGTPYKYGEDKKGKGTDCSGMILRIYEDILEIKLPRNSAKQAEVCKKIDKDKLKPGDLVFFATGKDSERISHVGMMLTTEEFIHASSSKGVVISNLFSPYYIRTYILGGKVDR